MKKYIYTLFMPLFIFISIVGTAFATWYFTDQIYAKEDIALSINVAKQVDVGNIEFVDENKNVLPNDYKYIIVADQKRIALNEKIRLKYTIDISNIDTSRKPNFTYNITLSTSIAKYVQINSPKATLSQKESGIYDFSWCDNFNFDEETFYTSDILFEYKADTAPTTMDQYNETYLALSQGSIMITFYVNY